MRGVSSHHVCQLGAPIMALLWGGGLAQLGHGGVPADLDSLAGLSSSTVRITACLTSSASSCMSSTIAQRNGPGIQDPRSFSTLGCPAYMPCATLKTFGGHKMLVRMQPFVQRYMPKSS